MIYAVKQYHAKGKVILHYEYGRHYETNNSMFAILYATKQAKNSISLTIITELPYLYVILLLEYSAGQQKTKTVIEAFCKFTEFHKLTAIFKIQNLLGLVRTAQILCVWQYVAGKCIITSVNFVIPHFHH